MVFVRPLSVDRLGDLALGFSRLSLPRSAREYLEGKLPHLQLLVTGLSREEARFLRAASEGTGEPARAELPLYVPGDAQRRPGTALLAGRRDQVERLAREAKGSDGMGALALALERALAVLEPPPTLTLGTRQLPLGRRTYVMGVVNVTPDSFSDGGRFLDPAAAVAHGEALARAGADILDVGGESTRPGAPAVSAQEELARVLPVLRALRERTEAPLSIDTQKAEVAEAALEAGAALVNDVSGFRHAPRLAELTARAQASCALMHLQGTPETMQTDPRYEDVVEEVIAALRVSVQAAEAAGISRDRILVDPGIGFGKTLGHNLFLLRRLADLRVLGCPILVGTSRKSFLGRLAGGRAAGERLAATLGSVAAMAVMGGADVVRVHDVAEARDALAVADAIRLAEDGGERFGGGPLALSPAAP